MHSVPLRPQVGLGAPLFIGYDLKIDGQQPVCQIAAHRSKVDAVQDHASPEGEHVQPAIGVEPAPHVSIAGHSAAERVRQPIRNDGQVIKPDHPRAGRRRHPRLDVARRLAQWHR